MIHTPRSLTGDFVKDSFECAQSIEYVKRELQRLAAAFDLTGNTKLASQLDEMVEVLGEETANVQNICSAKILVDYEKTKEATDQIVAVCLNSR